MLAVDATFTWLLWRVTGRQGSAAVTFWMWFVPAMGPLAYFRFATRHAALVELMFAAKHRPGAEELEDAAQRAFAMVLALIDEAQGTGELVGGDCERIGTTIFATLQGLTVMANGGMLPVEELDAAVTGTVEQLLDGLRPR